MTTFDLRSVKLRSGEEYRDEREIELTPLRFGGHDYLPVPGKVSAELAVLRATTGTVFELRFAGRIHGPCQRCLSDAVVDKRISVREYQAASPDATEELRTPYLVDERLDLSAWARDALALSLPDKILCRPDCRGLCPICGLDLNHEPHEHADEQVDPRWAALAELRERL